ncbi:MAG: hypothetical protein F6K39_43845 [Okeania sp. SIO3B3]|nr:hypothetical protein [Okeania sp. SIO3B3]
MRVDQNNWVAPPHLLISYQLQRFLLPMRYTHRGQDARTTRFSPFTLHIICPKYAVNIFSSFIKITK